jgi:hypothetical protein
VSYRVAPSRSSRPKRAALSVFRAMPFRGLACFNVVFSGCVYAVSWFSGSWRGLNGWACRSCRPAAF